MRCFLISLFLCLLLAVAVPFTGAVPASALMPGTRNAVEFPGASIIEKIQAVIQDCGSGPCAIYLPAGTYDASPISSWKNLDVTGSRVGIALQSNVEIRGAGEGLTTVRVVRAAGDPPATLFANATPAKGSRSDQNPNVKPASGNMRLRDMSIRWDDSAPTYDWVSIFICHACDRVELDHLSLEGNPNKLVNLLDNTHVDVHDCTFLLHSTSYGHGDNALGVSHFDSAVSPGNEAGVVRNNRFIEAGDYRTFSMLIVGQSGLYVHGNTFEAHFPPPGNATGIETGQDNTLHLPENVKISGNIFHGASIAHGGLNDSDISGNFLEHGDIYVALQSGTTASLSGLTIADNELHFGSISVAGLDHTSTGRCIITGNRIFDGSIASGPSTLIQDIEVIDNQVRHSSNRSGIDCNSCSLIRGNVVREIGQNAPGDMHPGYLIGGTVRDVSDNVYLDEQHEYVAGTICSVSSASSTVCLSSEQSRGTSRWILLRGGEWGFGWTNRTLFTDRGNFLIRAFVSNSVLELDENAAVLPVETHYHLFRTTFNAFELNSATIERFCNNLAIAPDGFRHAALQEDGTVRIRSISGNIFRPYSCSGKCTTDYRSNVSARE